MLRDFLLFIKYPYTAGIIAIVWIGTAIFLALADDLQLLHAVSIDLIVTIIMAYFGFRDKKNL